jgi:hypothetical protein
VRPKRIVCSTLLLAVIALAPPRPTAVSAEREPTAETPAAIAAEAFQAGRGAVPVSRNGMIVSAEDADAETVQVSGPGLELWLERSIGGGRVLKVSPEYKFCNGDRIAFKLRSNRPLHLLALLRAFPGPPRDERRPADEPEPSATGPSTRVRTADAAWRSLLSLEGASVPIEPETLTSLPTEPVLLGTEPAQYRLALAISTRPIDLSELFDPATGIVRAAEPKAAGGEGDSEPTPRVELNRLLESWRGNAAKAFGADGAAASYGLVRDPGTPAVVDVPIHHYDCARRMTLPSRADD